MEFGWFSADGWKPIKSCLKADGWKAGSLYALPLTPRFREIGALFYLVTLAGSPSLPLCLKAPSWTRMRRRRPTMGAEGRRPRPPPPWTWRGQRADACPRRYRWSCYWLWSEQLGTRPAKQSKHCYLIVFYHQFSTRDPQTLASVPGWYFKMMTTKAFCCVWVTFIQFANRGK